MNRSLAVWGLLLFIGFLATHVLVFSFNEVYVGLVWIILVIIGVAYSRTTCKCKGKTCKCSCCSDIWAIAAVEGIALTVAIMIGLVSISPFYILSVWLLVIGSTFLAKSFRDKRAVDMQLGVFWLFSAVFFPFLSNFESSTFIIGAIVFGIPMMVAGMVKGEK